MRPIKRAALSTPTLKKLAELQAKVQVDPSPRERAQILWDRKPKRAFQEIREALVEMAPGRARCLYCEDSMGTDIDHFWPKADYPPGAFCWHNYLLACSHCNSNIKREHFPRDQRGEPLLIDPTCDDPCDHLLFSPTTGEFWAVGSKGEQTIAVFGLNDDTPPRRLPTVRKHALIELAALIEHYDRQISEGDPRAAETRNCARQHPFSSVLVWLVSVASQPGAAHVIGERLVDLVERHAVASWAVR